MTVRLAQSVEQNATKSFIIYVVSLIFYHISRLSQNVALVCVIHIQFRADIASTQCSLGMNSMDGIMESHLLFLIVVVSCGLFEEAC